MSGVRLYTSPGCAYCLAAKQLLSSIGATYEELNLRDHPEEADRLREQYQWRSVPMIFINDEFVGGYDDIASLHQQGLLQQKLLPEASPV